MLSAINAHYFDEDIAEINEAIADVGEPKEREKFYLGKILYGITFYQPFNEELKGILDSNKQTAVKWAFPDTYMFRGSYKGKIAAIIILVISVVSAVILLFTGHWIQVIGFAFVLFSKFVHYLWQKKKKLLP